jgi:hypothetical protein
MRKNLLLVSLLSVAVLFAFGNCGPKKTMIKNGETYVDMEGWIDADTYQVKALGFAKDDTTDPLKRKYESRRAAQLNAEARIVEKLVGANVEGKTATEDGTLLGEVIKKSFEGEIKGGKIVQETYDKDTQACEISYQVSAKGLKKRAENANWVK